MNSIKSQLHCFNFEFSAHITTANQNKTIYNSSIIRWENWNRFTQTLVQDSANNSILNAESSCPSSFQCWRVVRGTKRNIIMGNLRVLLKLVMEYSIFSEDLLRGNRSAQKDPLFSKSWFEFKLLVPREILAVFSIATVTENYLCLVLVPMQLKHINNLYYKHLW